MPTKEWEKLSTKKPGDTIKHIIDDEAKLLLDMMVKDSAFEFKGGVDDYIKSERKLKKTRKALELSIKFKESHEVISKALEEYDEACKEKQRAVRNIKSEYLFLTCERDVKPPIDGIYVMKELIKQVVKELDDDEYEDLMETLKQKKIKTKAKK